MFIPEELREFISYVFSKALEGVKTSNSEFPAITKAGGRTEMLLNVSPRSSEHGEVIDVVGIGQDITNRVADNEESIRLIDTANTPIFAVNRDGRVDMWNRNMTDITQFTADEVIGEYFACAFVEEDHCAAVADALSRALSGEESANFEAALVMKTGRKALLLLNTTTCYNAHGRFVGVVVIRLDITDRVELKENEHLS